MSFRSIPEGVHFDVCVVGGAGHVGLPLSIVFADRGLRVLIYDVDARALDTISTGQLPFMERDAEPLLGAALATGHLDATTEAANVGMWCRAVWPE